MEFNTPPPQVENSKLCIQTFSIPALLLLGLPKVKGTKNWAVLLFYLAVMSSEVNDLISLTLT